MARSLGPLRTLELRDKWGCPPLRGARPAVAHVLWLSENVSECRDLGDRARKGQGRLWTYVGPWAEGGGSVGLGVVRVCIHMRVLG